LAKSLGTGNLDHRIAQLDFADNAVAECFDLPVADISRAATIVLVGCNVRHEMPLLHQRIHQAVKNGAKVHVLNPVDFEFTFNIASKAIVAPSKLAEALQSLSSSLQQDAVVILGEIAESNACASHIRAVASRLQQDGKIKLCRLPQGANAIGLAQHGVLPGEGGLNAGSMLDGSLKTLLLFGIEPQFDFIDSARAFKALHGAKLVVCCSYVSEALKEVADVILPIGALPEIQATLTNVNGINQQAEAAGKLPGLAQSGWRVLRALYDKAGLPALSFTEISGLRAGMNPQTVRSGSGLSATSDAADGFERIRTSPIYRVDAVTKRASALQAHPLTLGARAVIHPNDAQKHGLDNGQMVKVGDGNGSAALPLVLSTAVAEGCIWIESHYPATSPLSASVPLAIVRAAL
jgi:NADH-quinone oxidoreductase subunit G